MDNHIEKAVFPVTEATLEKVHEQLTEAAGTAERGVSERIPHIRLEDMPIGSSVTEITTSAGLNITFMPNGKIKLTDKWHEFNVILDHNDVWTLAKCLNWVWGLM